MLLQDGEEIDEDDDNDIMEESYEDDDEEEENDMRRNKRYRNERDKVQVNGHMQINLNTSCLEMF